MSSGKQYGTRIGLEAKEMPKGVPDHLYAFPENYGADECGR
jgi:hypothetical protein